MDKNSQRCHVCSECYETICTGKKRTVWMLMGTNCTLNPNTI